jgi:single-strand DNA-binding protein
MSLNRAMLIGYVGQDLEDLRYLPTSGQPVASFSVATDESFADKNGTKQERVDWHQVVVYGRLAEICKEYLTKAVKFLSRDVYARANTKPRTTVASGIAPRSSRSACSSLVRGLSCRPAVKPRPRPKTIFLYEWLRVGSAFAAGAPA